MKEAFIFDLDSKVSIYVPSTTDVNKADNEGLQERFVNLTIKEFSELFGGATATDAIGGWFSKEKGIVTNVDATNVDITITNNCGETTGVGGLIGYAVNSTISGCDLSGCDIDLNGTDTQNVGGLIGRLRAEASSVTDCSVANATLSARYCAGGVLGYVYEAAPTISHCTVAGSVTEQPALTLPSADVTMMTHTPGPFAITLPVWSTVATALSELSQVRVLSVAFSGSTVALTVVIPPGSSMRC